MQLINDKLVAQDKKYLPIARKYTPQEYEKMAEELDQTIKSQKSLGLGNPIDSHNQLSKGLKATSAAAEAGELYQAGYKYIVAPDAQTFPRFEGTEETAICVDRLENVPQFALVQLTGSTKKIRVTTRSGSSYEAPIPVIPSTHQELARRAKEIAPNAEFHLAYLPSWKQMPTLDPALLIKILDPRENKEHWFQVGDAWGGDKELLQEHIIPKVLTNKK